jgi:hypothetical protein
MTTHAWTILCTGSLADPTTGEMVMSPLDEVVLPPSILAPRRVVEVPQRIDVVSLWHRDAVGAAQSTEAVIRVESPDGERLASLRIPVAFAPAQRRARTRHIMPSIPVAGPGTHTVVVELGQGDRVREVARVPYEVRGLAGG